MARVSIKFVVSFSSQDDNHKVSNIVDSNGLNYWLSHPKEKSGLIEAIFQLEKECLITNIDVGSVWCANIELKVGRSDWVHGVEYKTLLPTVGLTNPIECKNGEGTLKNRTFSFEHFFSEVCKEKWDRIKVICRQPFRKDVQFGLSYIRIKSATPRPQENTMGNGINGKTAENKAVVKSIQKHFFGRTFLNNKERVDPLQSKLLKIAGTSENGIDQEVALPRTAKLVLAATENIGKFSPQSRTKTYSSVKDQLFSECRVQKYGPKFEDEVTDFLGTLQLEDFDLDNITIADLRHRFEKIQKRKLSGDEKRIFMELCQNYICDLFDKLDNKTLRLPSNSESKIENDFPSSRKRKANVDTNLSSPKTKKIGLNGIRKPQVEISTTSKTDPSNYKPTPKDTFIDFSTKSPVSGIHNSSTIDEKHQFTMESCIGGTDTNHSETPSKSKVIKSLNFSSPSNHKQSLLVVRKDLLSKNKDANSNDMHQTDSPKISIGMEISAVDKNNTDHSHIKSLVAVIKKNFPNSSSPQVRNSVTNVLSNTQFPTTKQCTNAGHSAVKRFPYRGLQLEIGSDKSRTKAPSINKLVSDIQGSACGSKSEWLSKAKGLGCSSILTTDDHITSPVSTATRVRGEPVRRATTVKSRGGKIGRGSPSTTSRPVRGDSAGEKQKNDDWSGANFELCFTEDAVDSPVFHNCVFCSSCKGNIPKHLYSHHYLTCCRDASSTSPCRGVPTSSGVSPPSTTCRSQVSQDKDWTVVSDSDSDSDLDVSVKLNNKCVSCPICEKMFPEDVIMTHANYCCETIGFH